MSEELCYGSFIVKKLKKISFQYLLVLIFFTLRNQSLFITWGRVGEFLGDPAVFFWGGGGGGAEGDRSSLTELRRTTIELTASEVGSLQYYRTLRGDQVNFMVKQTEYSRPSAPLPRRKNDWLLLKFTSTVSCLANLANHDLFYP